MPISPLQASTDVFDRAEALLAAADTITDSMVSDDMRRFASAQGVAALDTYLHWAVAKAPLDNMPSALKKLEVSFDDLVTLSEAMVANRAKIKPKVRARHVLERVILTKTFQSKRAVEDAMQMLGRRNAFEKISTKIDPHQTKSEIEERLGRIVHRRNQVVHEGDLQRQSRPQRVKRESVDAISIQNDLVWLRSFVIAIDDVLKPATTAP